MLKKILSPSSCAECQWCCQFDESDIWEMPWLSPEAAENIRTELPGVRLKERGRGFDFDTPINPESELAVCPALTKNGCMLGDKKPLDCRIWPFRIMKIADKTAITLSAGCPSVSRLSISAIKRFLDDGFAERVFAYARENPEAVHPYRDGYLVIAFDK